MVPTHCTAPPAAGFPDPVLDAQRTFRAVLDAMAHPGRLVSIRDAPEPPQPLAPATAALALTLIDFETPVWLDAATAEETVAAWLRFHCGCAGVESPETARFALIGDAASMPPLTAFDAGTPEYPDLSTTVVIQVAGLAEQQGGLRLTGPGIDGTAELAVPGLPAAFPAWLRDNHAQFPCGVDVVLVAGPRLAALPRTTLAEA